MDLAKSVLTRDCYLRMYTEKTQKKIRSLSIISRS
ncbi:unnamed protein product [Arabidopsis halleri]